MSTQDDKTKDVSEYSADNTNQTQSKDADSPGDIAISNGSNGLVFLFFILGFIASLIIGWIVFPPLLYSKKKQPIDFNHVRHLELVDNECESCHFFHEDGSFSGSPGLAQCIECHNEVQGDTDHEKDFIENYLSKGREVPWDIYSKQPDCVFFSHAAHVKMAQMTCETCHGNMGNTKNLRDYEENIITGYSRDIWGRSMANMLTLKKHTYERMKMDDCAKCHEAEKGKGASIQTEKEGCFVCHK
jgi:hypothetical protein